MSATDYLRLYYQIQSNRLITIDTNYVRTQHKLPDNADVSASGMGVELVMDKTDYRTNPTKGWSLRLNVTGMLRRVRKSDAVLALQDGSFDFATLYDSVNRQKYQYQFTGISAGYIPLARMLTLKLGYQGGWLSSNNLFQNELFRLGGFQLLRGFDEQSIYANLYQLAIIELRVRFDRNSYAYLFSDNAFVQSNFNQQQSQGIYNGLGIGAALESKSGIFSISYALGRSDNNPVIQFRQSKIHLGYVAYF
jgi:hemolysin activation/secretion protein